MTLSPLRPYLSADEREADIESLAGRAGATIVEYGRSVQGAPLRAVRVPCPTQGAPRLLCCANIHGPEFVAGRVAAGLLEAVAAADPEATSVCRRAELWIVPCVNPDGYARTWKQGGQGPLSELRTNANGVDLNRNFPLPRRRRIALPGSGSDTPGAATFRGRSALCEPETRALDELFGTVRFHASANLHSFMGTTIPARVTDTTSFRAYRRLCAAFQNAQPKFRYRRLSSRVFDVFTGEQEDHQHHRHGTWAICVETFTVMSSYAQHLRAPSTFWRFNPRDPTPWVENDVKGLLAYFSSALELTPPSQPA